MSAPLPPSGGDLAAAPQSDAGRRMLESTLLYGFAVFAALLVIFAGVIAEISGTEIQLVTVALATLLLALVPAAIDHSRPTQQRHLLLTIFSLSFACFYVFPLLTQYFLAETFVEGRLRLLNIDPPDILMGQAIALLGLCCLYLGYLYPVGRFLSTVFPKPTAEWTHPTALAVAVLMIMLGWVVFLGGAVGLIPRRAGSGVLGAIASSVYFGIGLLAIIYLRYRSQPARILMWLFVPPTMMIAFLTGSKRFALSPLITIAIAYIVVERRIRFIWVAGGLFALIGLYPIAQFWREVSWTGSLSFVQWLLSPLEVINRLSAFMGSADFGEYFRSGLVATGSRLDLLGITSVIVRDTPSEVPFQGGWTLAYIPISFIPRLLWAGKPEFHTGKWVTDNYGAGPDIMSSTGSGWIGELYFNFGLAGVILGMLIIGALFRILHETLFRADATIPALLAGVVVIWTTCPTIEMNLLAPFSGGVFHLAPVLLAHMVVRSMVGTTTPAVLQTRTPPPKAA